MTVVIWSRNQIQAAFLQHEGYLGALGALMSYGDPRDENLSQVLYCCSKSGGVHVLSRMARAGAVELRHLRPTELLLLIGERQQHLYESNISCRQIDTQQCLFLEFSWWCIFLPWIS